MRLKIKAAAFICTLIIAAGFAVSANYSAEIDAEKIKITAPDGQSNLILSGYDSDGKLVGARYLTANDGVFEAELIAGAEAYRAGDPSKTDTFEDVDISETESTAAPASEPTASPEPTASAAPTASPSPTPKTYPAAYLKEKDAVYTFAVIESISSTLNESGEHVYNVDMLIRGEEETLEVPEETQIVLASDYYSSLTGSSVSALKKGDIVYFDISLSNRVRGVALIYRPVKDNPVTSDEDYGSNFEKLISTNGRVYANATSESGVVIPFGTDSAGAERYQYAFGLIGHKNKAELTLYNRTGKFSDTISVSFTSDTIVYVCDVENKNEVSIATVGALSASPVGSSSFDDDDNMTYSDENLYNYAFARVVDGIASEIVIFTGCGA